MNKLTQVSRKSNAETSVLKWWYFKILSYNKWEEISKKKNILSHNIIVWKDNWMLLKFFDTVESMSHLQKISSH